MELYRKWGWTEDDFLLAFRKNPQIMELAEKNFSSKMDFLVNKMGWHPADVAGSSVALNYSLEKYIIPRCLVIRVLLSKGLRKFSDSFNTSGHAVHDGLRAVKNTVEDVAVALVISLESDKFKENIKKVTSMGVPPSSATFMRALYMFARVNESERVQKMELYRKWGWTEDDFLLAFRKNPQIMELAEKNFSSKMDFLVTKVGWLPADVAGSPIVIVFSLRNWIIPRCSVIRILMSKGLIVKGEFSMATLLGTGKDYFLDRFVVKYQEQVPELPSIFKVQMGLSEPGLGFEQKEVGVKQL
ncbi:uncharacterized protein [Pyrus communis]|uniref:uncharacterized protein n=1 Tax=Pyrus communis TaxID=23211 RepID=UPI0035C0321E